MECARVEIEGDENGKLVVGQRHLDQPIDPILKLAQIILQDIFGFLVTDAHTFADTRDTGRCGVAISNSPNTGHVLICDEPFAFPLHDVRKPRRVDASCHGSLLIVGVGAGYATGQTEGRY
ncbi:hypothetical protein D3C85_1577950 [compost metagenome]